MLGGAGGNMSLRGLGFRVIGPSREDPDPTPFAFAGRQRGELAGRDRP